MSGSDSINESTRQNRSTEPASTDFTTVFRDELELIRYRRKALQVSESADDSDAYLETANLKTLPQMQKCAFKAGLTGLAISGGGIRSATFALGVLQRLAVAGILPRIDYLSTVSGGGYIGSWLSAWIYRDGFRSVERALQPLAFQREEDASQVEASQIRHLRNYGNYLAPTPSLFSIDGWALIAIFLRNLVLNLSVFFLAMLAVVFATRGVVEVYTICHTCANQGIRYFITGIAIVSALWAVYCSGTYARDASAQSTDKSLQLVVIPWMTTAFLLSLVLVLPTWTATLREFDNELTLENVASDGSLASDLVFSFPDFWSLFRTFGIITVVLSFVYGWLSMRDRIASIRGGLAGLVAGFIGGLLVCTALYVSTRSAMRVWYESDVETVYSESIYVALGSTVCVPIILLVLVAISFFRVGFAGNRMSAIEREWWSSINSRLMMAAIAWLCLFSTVVFGPWLIGKILTGNWVGWLAGSGWLGTVAAGVLAARGSRTGEGNASFRERLARLAPILVIATASIGFATTGIWLCYDVYTLFWNADSSWYFVNRQEQLLTDLDDAKPLGELVLTMAKVPADTTLGQMISAVGTVALPLLLFALALLLAQLSKTMGNRIGVNTFSLQDLYANRLTRCYLGASNSNRQPEPLSRLDPNDDIAMHLLGEYNQKQHGEQSDLRPVGPLHIVNTALNHSPSDHRPSPQCNHRPTSQHRLSLLERQAESFIFSPLYCGSESTGYHKSKSYAGGISLGTAMALSGAAISPNMGYHTSGAIRILLTLFNVRLGGWYRNPLTSTHDNEEHSSPDWKLMLAELLGRTGVDEEFVYISDGGHFENMGVYELIRRRCRFIIATDAGSDPTVHDNIGRLVRQVRIDFGVDIDIDAEPLTPNEDRNVDQHYVIARIRYPNVRESSRDPNHEGMIVWVKTGIVGDEPADVATYRATNPGFPYQSTVDQFFGETQFEAYRELGETSIDALLRRLDDTGGRPSGDGDLSASPAREHASNREFFLAIENACRPIGDSDPN